MKILNRVIFFVLICLTSNCSKHRYFPIEIALSDSFFNQYKEEGKLLLDLHYYRDEHICNSIKSKYIQCNEDSIGLKVKHITLMDYLDVNSTVTCQFECFSPQDDKRLIFYCAFKHTIKGYTLSRKSIGEIAVDK